MGLVLAIDPGRRHGKVLGRLSRDLATHDIVVVESSAEALSVLDTSLPHLVVFPLFLAPSDEARLQARLRDLPTRTDIHALTLPLAAFVESEREAGWPTAVPPRWYYWFRPAVVDAVTPDDVGALANAVRRELALHLSEPAPAASSPVDHVPQVSSEDARSPIGDEMPAVVRAPWQSPPPSLETIVIDAIANQAELEIDQDPVTSAPPAALPSMVPPVALPPMDVWARPGADWNVPTVPVPAAVQTGASSRRFPAFGGQMWNWLLLIGGVTAVVATLGVTHVADLGTTGWLRAAGSALPIRQAPGVLDLQSVPERSDVFIGGRAHGVTPLRLELPAGEHDVEFRRAGSAQTVQLTVVAGTTIVHRVEWSGHRQSGSLKVDSQPSGAAVLIDGKKAGLTPLVVDDLAVGVHEVELKLGANVVRQSVDIKAGQVATLDSGVYVGWLALFSPIELAVREQGRKLSLDERNRVMLAAGAHELTLENRALGFSTTRSVQIQSGEVTAESIDVPKTQLTVTAPSPTEIWIDGARAGETPLVDWPVDIGTREIVARAPGRGERKLTVTATVQPVHLAVELP